MGNILDYIKWRGDLEFDKDEFNSIDALILSQFSYLNLEDIVPESFSKKIKLKEALNIFLDLSYQKKRLETGLLISDEILSMFNEMGKSKRFSDIKLCGYVNLIDKEEEKQFSAVTSMLNDGSNIVIFRGTDDTLVGWKEDFNMSFLDHVPSQSAAVEYLTKAGECLEGSLRVAGHSKGGNLAIYSSAYCSEEIRKRIICIYNNDGPGFSQEFLSKKSYKDIYKKIYSYVPQSSVVGMMFSYHREFNVVQSRQFGLFQHNPFNWQVLGNKFVLCDKITDSSEFADNTLRDWILKMDNAQKEKFVDALFEILDSTDAKTLTELKSDGIKNSGLILKNISALDDETKEILIKTAQLLIKSAKENLVSNKSSKPAAKKRINIITSKIPLPKGKKYIIIKEKKEN